MNNNLTTERSHLGVFSTTTYITIGDVYGKKRGEHRYYWEIHQAERHFDNTQHILLEEPPLLGLRLDQSP